MKSEFKHGGKFYDLQPRQTFSQLLSNQGCIIVYCCIIHGVSKRAERFDPSGRQICIFIFHLFGSLFGLKSVVLVEN